LMSDSALTKHVECFRVTRVQEEPGQ
jgi:hypothetical protein